MKKFNLTFLAAMFAVSIFANDILTLNNEMVFEGKVNSINENEIVFTAASNEYIVPVSDIYSIQFGDTENKVLTDFLAQSDNYQDNCLNGKLDAELYHGKKGLHFALGFLFGPFAIIGTAISSPTPERGVRTLYKSKNKDQFNNPEYLSCYRKKAKAQLIGAEALGWGAWILLLLIL